MTTLAQVPAPEIAARIEAIDGAGLVRALDEGGYAVVPALLTPGQCSELAAAWRDDGLFRRHIVMQQHGYGHGEYKYFAYPLPALVETLRTGLYERLVPVANAWLTPRDAAPYPPTHREYLARCHDAGQLRPTPLLLRYIAGDYNRLHQDLYGEHVFPLQLTILLSAPGRDFDGGELVLTEQRARMQSRPMVVPLNRGDAVVFAVDRRPVRTARGTATATMRHGVSLVRSGERLTAGIIFHDAR